jgi:hypothetical protein
MSSARTLVEPRDLTDIIDAEGQGASGAWKIERGEGIRRGVGRDQGTEQDTQGQHSRQE